MRWLSLLSLVLSVALISCSASTTAVPPTVTSPQESPSAVNLNQIPAITNQGQKLPISAQAIAPNGTKIELEVARTPRQQSMGLMYRPALPDNRGMLFQFTSPQSLSFWMKNVPVPLDMVFMRNGLVQYIVTSAPPCASEPCPTYGSKKPADQVIELRSGRSAELGLKEGDRLQIEFLESGSR